MVVRCSMIEFKSFLEFLDCFVLNILETFDMIKAGLFLIILELTYHCRHT